MESSPKIIELYGLPGCGKTTLCNRLHEKYPKTTIDVELIWDGQKLYRKILEIPFWILVKLCWLFIISPKLPRKEWNIYIGFLVHLGAYSYIKKTKYKYLLSDNGLVQDMVSLFYKKESSFSKKHLKAFYNIAKEYDNSFQIFCDIPVNMSLERIRKRNRNKGRLDLISNDKMLAESLTTQSDFFNKMNEVLQCMGVKYLVLNMNDSVDNLADKVTSEMSFGK